MSDFRLATRSSRMSVTGAGGPPVAAESPGRAESTPKRRTPSPPSEGPRQLRDAKGDHHAVACRDDREDVPLVVGDEPVVFDDGLGRRTSPVVLELLGARHPAGPQHVVADVEAPDADAISGGTP